MLNRLAEHLASEGVSQTEFAQRCGIPQPAISQWVNGKRRPGIANAIRIERATNGAVPVSYWAELPQKKVGC